MTQRTIETPAFLADIVLVRCRDNGDGCLIWMLECSNGGKDPRLTVDRKKVLVRRLIWSAMHDGRDPGTMMVGVSCGTRGCVEPSHIIARTHAEALRGHVQTLAQRAAVAAGKRAASPTSQELVQQIRESEGSSSAVALSTGLSRSFVAAIRRGAARRDYYATPFTGLGAR